MFSSRFNPILVAGVAAGAALTSIYLRRQQYAAAGGGDGGADTGGLVPLPDLLGNPRYVQPRLSPNGRVMSFIAPNDDNVLNVHVKPLADVIAAAGGEGESKGADGGADSDRSDAAMAGAKIVTSDKKRGIRWHAWAEDGSGVLYMQDGDGDENFHLFKVPIAEDGTPGPARDLTPWQGVRVQKIEGRKKFPGQLLVGLNLRDKSCFDMHRIDLTTGAVTLDTENAGTVDTFLADDDFVVRAAYASNPKDGSHTLRVRDSDKAEWRDLMHFPFEEEAGPVGFNKRGDGLYLETSVGADTTRLVEVDIADGSIRREIASSPHCDVGEVEIDEDTREVDAVSFNHYVATWTAFGAMKKDIEVLQAASREGGVLREFQIVSKDHGNTKWLVAFMQDTGPVMYSLYDRESGKVQKLFTNRPELTKHNLVPMYPTTITARDGVKLVAYLTLPPGIKPPSVAKEDGSYDLAAFDPPLKLPMVLYVHGGPWARDTWGFDPVSQLLSSRGYAVLKVNFRGSAGLGKKFLNLGNCEWGVGTMQHDLTDSVRWAVDCGIADKERVAIHGGSYGGYAVLAGLAFTPDLYACGVDVVGPSHIKTLLESIPAYWAPFKKQLILRVGDAEGDEEVNKKISPLFHVSKITKPLMIGHGSNDPRVKLAESDQIVTSMRSKGIDVDYLVYPDEGHGFARPNNRLDFYSRMEQFFAKHLGGKASKPLEVEGTTVESR